MDESGSGSSSVNKKLYATSLLTATAALIVVRIFALPKLSGASKVSTADAVTSMVDSLIGASAAALCISLLIMFFYGIADRGKGDVLVVPSKSIALEVREAAERSGKWEYRGHTGRYLRSTVLPILQLHSGQEGQYVELTVQLLDPSNISTIDFFTEYRKSLNPNRPEYWVRRRAQAEITATILKLGTASARFSRLTCKVYLTSSVSPLSVDMSDSCVIITREKAGASALKYPAGSTFYDSMKEELSLDYKQGSSLNLANSVQDISTVDHVRNALSGIGILAGADDELLALILDAYERPVNPYGNS